MVPAYESTAEDRAAARLARATQLWAAALREHEMAEPNPEFAERLRSLAQAALEERAACQELADTGLLWRPMPGAEQAQPPYELRPGTGRRGPTELWETFDAAILRLNHAVGQSDPLIVGAAFANLAGAATVLADAVGREDAGTAGRRRRTG